MFWGGGGVKHAGVSVYPIATAGMQPPGKADIPQSRAVQRPGYKNNASLDMRPIPEQERQKSNGNTHTQHTFKIVMKLIIHMHSLWVNLYNEK